MTPRLRPARADDLGPVLDVFLACWRIAYQDLLPQPTLDALTDDDATELWRRALADAGSRTLVAEHEGRVVGVVRWTPADATVQSLYVHPGHQGQGTGATLLGAAADALAGEGAPTARLWVFAANAPAQAFYRRHGWVPDGARRVEERFGAPELRLERTLEPTTMPTPVPTPEAP